MVILLVVFLPLAQLVIAVLGQASTARTRLTALSLAEQYLEILDNQGPPTTSGVLTLNKTITEETVTKSGNTYTVKAKFNWNASKTPVCTLATAPKTLKLLVTVTWARGSQTLHDHTLIDYPAPDDVDKGFLLVQILGSAAKDATTAHHWSFATRAAAVPITIEKTTGTPRTQTVKPTPTSTGCVFEPETQGTYTVSVGQASAAHSFATTWVANADESTATQSKTDVSVVAGLVTTETFQWDEGAYIGVAYPQVTATGGFLVCPNKGSIQCLASGQSAPNTSKLITTGEADLDLLKSTGWNVSHPTVTVSNTKYPVTRFSAAACTASSSGSFTNRCLAVGTVHESSTNYQAATAVSPVTTPPAFTASTLTGTALTTIGCPSTASATTAYCYAGGYNGTAPEILNASVPASSGTAITWTTYTPSLATYTAESILGPVCAATKTCYAVVEFKRTRGSGTTPKFGIFSVPATGTSWGADTITPTTAITSVKNLVCASALSSTSKPVCYVVATTTSTAWLELSTSTTTTAKWVKDSMYATNGTTVATTTKTVTSITCPAATKCYEVGTTTGSKGFAASSAGATKWTRQTVTTTGITAMTTVACASTTRCYAIAAKSGGLLFVSLVTSGSTHNKWKNDTNPTGITLSTINEMTCVKGTRCIAIVTTSGTTATDAAVLGLPSSVTTVKVTKFTTPSAAHYNELACASTTRCAAIGASETAAVFAGGAVGGTTWTAATPTTGLPGVSMAKVPVAVGDTGLKPSTTLEVAANETGLTYVGPLYPFTAGYSVSAAQCSGQVSTASGSATSVPGTSPTQAKASPVTLPMGILAIRAVNKYGRPDPSATVKAKLVSSTCTALTTISTVSNDPTPYTLETTDALGWSAQDVMYGTYQVTLKTTTPTTKTIYVSVSPSLTKLYTSAALTTFSTVVFPTPVVVVAT